MRVTTPTPDDWQVVRHLRLGGLADTPDAFGAVLDDEAAQPEAWWRARLARPDAITMIASLVGEDGEARPAGTAVVAPAHGQPDTAGIYSVWVAPSGRGRGVGDALIEACVDHAARVGHRRVVLDVGDFNVPAQRLYTRHGFRPTGRVGSLPPPRTDVTEHELARDLP